MKAEFTKEIADKEKVKAQKEELTLRNAELEESKLLLEKKFEEQTKEIQDLKSELCRAEDDKQAVKISLDKQKEQILLLESKFSSVEEKDIELANMKDEFTKEIADKE